MTLCPEVIIPWIAWKTVSLLYAKQLVQPGVEFTHKKDSAEQLTKLLRTVNVSAPLESLKEASPAVGAAMTTFLENFKGLIMHQVSKIVKIREDLQHCNYINLVVNKTHVQAILDTGAPGNIIVRNCRDLRRGTESQREILTLGLDL
ncbi:hypothetical protein DSO57_1016074 [Entomophthora muscae]|uniref:Uncharacterized protein n=1 Tax=Entomophthora muscae TaxID=34485 RepID=A0ACC2S705_9FUNG|nr:hypothetical protein DSO57_1016074 [Entomophthora muscae]